MARPEKDDKDKKKPRTISMTDNEWAHLKSMAKPNEVSAYVIQKLRIKNDPLKE